MNSYTSSQRSELIYCFLHLKNMFSFCFRICLASLNSCRFLKQSDLSRACSRLFSTVASDAFEFMGPLSSSLLSLPLPPSLSFALFFFLLLSFSPSSPFSHFVFSFGLPYYFVQQSVYIFYGPINQLV